jgi:hypothetical protein
MRAKLEEIKEELRRRMEQPIPEARAMVGAGRQWILRLSRGADQLCGTGAFRTHVVRLWLWTLRVDHGGVLPDEEMACAVEH